MKKIFGVLCLMSFFATAQMNAQVKTTENVSPVAADVVKKDESKKACSADCVKACCTKDAKACASDCSKACCAKGVKCSKADMKACKTDAKACAAKCAKADAAATKAAMTDEMVERKVCAHSGKVSYSKKNVCEKSGKVSYSDVIYDTEKAKFVDLEVAPVNGDVLGTTTDKAAPKKACKKGKKCCAKGMKKADAAPSSVAPAPSEGTGPGTK